MIVKTGQTYRFEFETWGIEARLIAHPFWVSEISNANGVSSLIGFEIDEYNDIVGELNLDDIEARLTAENLERLETLCHADRRTREWD